MTNPIGNNQNNNKCPHGLPSGACPICSGMGGGRIPKDRNKPRVAGEMSYNECMAVWIKMQNAKKAKAQNKIDKLNAAHFTNAKEILKSEFARIQNKINTYFEKLNNTIQKLPPVIKSVAILAIKAVHVVVSVAINIVFSVSNLVLSVCEKMAMVLAEIKNHISSFIQKTIDKTKKAIKTLLSLFMEFEQENENSDKQKIEEIVKNAVKKVLKKEEKEDELV